MKLTNLTDKEYRSIPAESYSSIKYMLESPIKFQYYKDKPFTGNASTDLGTAVHHYLQKNKHLIHYKVKVDKKIINTEEDPNFMFIKSNPDGIILLPTAEEKILTIVSNYEKNEKAVKILMPCDYEIGFKNTLKTSCGRHLVLKGKVDGYHAQYLVDIKTTRHELDIKTLKGLVDSSNYDLQAALYLHLSEAKHENYYFVFCQTSTPFQVKRVKMSKESIARGKQKLQLAIDNYKKYIIDGEPYEEPDEEV
jgi:PDDEXK-like uncharacterized protein DUF3799